MVDGVVPLPGPLLGFLVGPAQLSFESLADVPGMKSRLGVSLDQVGDAGGGPQLGPTAVNPGILGQQLIPSLEVPGVEPRRAAGVRLGGEDPRGVAGVL